MVKRVARSTADATLHATLHATGCTPSPAGRRGGWGTKSGHEMALEGLVAMPDDTPSTFGAALEQFMLRAKIWDTALARRLEASRSEVFRWRTGRAMPSRRNLERLQNALQWSSNGTLMPLDPAEWERLLVLAGHGMPRPS